MDEFSEIIYGVSFLIATKIYFMFLVHLEWHSLSLLLMAKALLVLALVLGNSALTIRHIVDSF